MDSLILEPGLMMTLPSFQIILAREVNSSASQVPHHALHDAKAIKEFWLKHVKT